MKKTLLLLLGLLMTTVSFAQKATVVDDISTYTGKDTYVYNNADHKYYALNNLGKYEEYGLYTTVKTLKTVGGGTATQIEYIQSDGVEGTPYINLNYIPKKNTRIEATFVATEGPDWKAIYGCGYYAGGWQKRFCYFTTNYTINCDGETGGDKAKFPYGTKVKTVQDGALGTLVVYTEDGAPIDTIVDKPKAEDCATPLYVFAQNKDIPGGNKQTDCYNTYLTLYGLDIYEGETLMMQLVPAVDSEGNGGLLDKLTNKFYGSANDGKFALSDDGQEIADETGITAYEGKRVRLTTDNHEYKYQNGQWVDCGALGTEAVDGTYKDLRTWTTDDAHAGVFAGMTYDESTGKNEINPYAGTGGWEPLSTTVALEQGESYNMSFTYRGSAWNSWSSYKTLNFYVWDKTGYPGTSVPTASDESVFGMYALPNTAQDGLPVSFDFAAKQATVGLCIQFGVVDDGEKGFWFGFDKLQISKYVFTDKYPALTKDVAQYTPLEYIESTIDTQKENAYTTPYKFQANSLVQTKFMSYGTGNWRAIFSGRDVHAGTGISLYLNGNGQKLGYFVGTLTGAGDNYADYPGDNVDVTVEAGLDGLTLNDTYYSAESYNPSYAASTRGISLFANPEWDNRFIGRIYYMKFLEDEEEVYDFEPVMRHDGAYGFYDKKNDYFVLPAQVGTYGYNGYGFKTLADQAYLRYDDATRVVLVGKGTKFEPTLKQNLDDATFTWTSSDPSVAAVDANGKVTGLKAGTATITCTTSAADGWTASFEVTVLEMNATRYDADGVGYMFIDGGTNTWGDGLAKNIIDGDATTKLGCSNQADAWATIMSSEPVAVKQYSLVTGADTYYYARNPRSWQVYGSMDNQDWTLIDEHVDDHAMPLESSREVVFPVNGTEKYQYFKFVATALNNNGFQLSEFWINEQKHSFGEAKVTDPTCMKNGKKEYTCTDCKAVRAEAIQPTYQHTYEDGVCTVCSSEEDMIFFLPGGQLNPYSVKALHAVRNSDESWPVDPSGWTAIDYDDSSWDNVLMPIGSAGYNGGPHDDNTAQYNSLWYNQYNNYWFRIPFKLKSLEFDMDEIYLDVLHDDSCRIYLNGEEVYAKGGWTEGATPDEVSIDGTKMVEGVNVLAVYCQQNYGGAYFDAKMFGYKNGEEDPVDHGYVTTGITNVNTKGAKSGRTMIYNIAGQRLSKPQRGINIINGKKVIVK